MGHTEAQLDFILEMYAADNPKLGMKFVRPGKEPPPPQSFIDAAWERVLVGKAHDVMMGARMPSEAVLKRLRENQYMKQYDKPIIRRGPAAPPLEKPKP